MLEGVAVGPSPIMQGTADPTDNGRILDIGTGGGPSAIDLIWLCRKRMLVNQIISLTVRTLVPILLQQFSIE